MQARSTVFCPGSVVNGAPLDTGAAVRLSWSAVSETGSRDNNQDRIGAARNGELACFVVADGAGGH
ncbi:MAG: serine/threonine protein phosphatase, partial [Massilia sp.]|nr:serine/threonine protein phosphatase [Massilia sp.]